MTLADKTSALQASPAEDRDWWRGAVIYQIYPRSFQDTSGDGIGDLMGIAQRLPYVASLGVDAIWVSPFFTSPMKDFGYDISDYNNVDPMFGTLGDFDHLIREAHRLGIRVMIDLVISHTADSHPWFVESRSSRDNPKADWYVWADPKPDGTPPNNWLAIFGGSAWAWDPSRLQYYQHNFLVSQPDLNFHNPEVQQAVLDAARFWLDRGVDGFRLDTINFYFCDAELRDNPALAIDERNDSIAPSVNPYNYQNHLYDKNRPENLDFLRRFRSLMDEYPAIAAVGEVGDAQYGLQIVADYTSGGDKMQMCYAFDFLANEPLSPQRVRNVVEKFGAAAPEGWACWAFSNHDVVRHASRWGNRVADRDHYLKLLAGVLLSLRGSVCLYQGEELGLTEAELSFEDLRDPYGIQFWPDFKGRDGCRTPMVWSEHADSAGFTDGQPWLPLPTEHRQLAVDVQDHLHASLLNHYRAMLQFRAAHPALIKGDIEFLQVDDSILSFTRRFEGETLFCAFNFSETERQIEAAPGTLSPVEQHCFSGIKRPDGTIVIPAYDAYFADLKEDISS
ncbi:alpha-glucosidase family protein [Pseudohoeflea coraliihabitans]|uniref:Alpha-glucosidase family protein n=1 Tax=Pseudohoeflea coraliihabitans TaxID=2860393 RepID=A0ABS6WNZ2_9HYPH|nr:alpha-glucosidase family protein [Pseudohoeflea sp. DP4N28-3]MBW3097338.1 alpha-glucosidase family protein [Pseudohoeflea sp. DP4N28-3]